MRACRIAAHRIPCGLDPGLQGSWWVAVVPAVAVLQVGVAPTEDGA